ncbi:hypothetical protein Pan14r_14740 [Crateriforma conspicua]|uniref:Uncharacterized protein n=1 Tax=Crateriforma conspicua TaxID=2527996 RepID=A0A5C5Y314_9PLAN|nr:hypothetical protein Pan14r_14740 [Crateriforma conspicua]
MQLFKTAVILVITITTLVSAPRWSPDLPHAEADVLHGREDLDFDDACCEFNEDCDGTEVLCSGHGRAFCESGNARGYRTKHAANRDICNEDSAIYLGRSCTEDWSDELECAEWDFCDWDPAISKCTAFAGTVIPVPLDCDSTCP